MAVVGGYLNGRLPDSVLVPIAPGQRLQPEAARAYLAMTSAAAQDGVRWTVTDSYRTLAQQTALAKTKGLYSEGGLAAKPGTSQHGYGLAVDLDLKQDGVTWLQRNAVRFGFSTIPREPWHWQYGGGTNSQGVSQMANPRVAGDFTVSTADIPNILAVIRYQESGSSAGNYTAHAKVGTASGAYQYTDATWGGYGGYPTAAAAPPAIQDAKARDDVQRVIQTYGGSAAAIPMWWYYPASLDNPTLLDTIPGKGNTLTIRSYTTKWLTALRTNLTNNGGPGESGPFTNMQGAVGDTNGDDDCLWRLPNVDPLTSLPGVGRFFPSTDACVMSRPQGRALAGATALVLGGIVMLIGFAFVMKAELSPPTITVAGQGASMMTAPGNAQPLGGNPIATSRTRTRSSLTAPKPWTRAGSMRPAGLEG